MCLGIHPRLRSTNSAGGSLTLWPSSSSFYYYYYCNRVPLIRLTGTANHPDTQKIQITEFFFENMLHWQFGVEKKILKTAVLSYIFTGVQIIH